MYCAVLARGLQAKASMRMLQDSVRSIQADFEDLDNCHLQDTLDTYKYAPSHFWKAPHMTMRKYQGCLFLDRDSLEEAGHAQGAQGWLNVSLQTARGTEQLYSLLQQYVQKPAFLQKLTAARVTATGAALSISPVSRVSEQRIAPTCPEYRHPDNDVMQAGFWEPAPELSATEVLSLQSMQLT